MGLVRQRAILAVSVVHMFPMYSRQNKSDKNPSAAGLSQPSTSRKNVGRRKSQKPQKPQRPQKSQNAIMPKPRVSARGLIAHSMQYVMPSLNAREVVPLSFTFNYPTVLATGQKHLILLAPYGPIWGWIASMNSAETAVTMTALTSNYFRSFCTANLSISASTAAVSTRANVETRHERACYSVICSTSLAAVQGMIYGKRFSGKIPWPGLLAGGSSTAFRALATDVTDNGHPVSSADLVSGLCVESLPTTLGAFEHPGQPYDEIIASPVTELSTTSTRWFDEYCGNSVDGPGTYNSWAPVVLYADNTSLSANDVRLNLAVESTVTMIPNADTYLNAIAQLPPIGSGVEVLSRTRRLMQQPLWTRPKMPLPARNVGGYIGI